MISFKKLEMVLKEKGLNKFYLRNNGINPTQLNKMIVSGDCGGKTIDKLCKLLNCQPGDIMAYIPDEATQRQLSTTDTPPIKKESPPQKEKLTPSILLAEDGKRGTSASTGKDTPIEENDLLPWKKED